MARAQSFPEHFDELVKEVRLLRKALESWVKEVKVINEFSMKHAEEMKAATLKGFKELQDL